MPLLNFVSVPVRPGLAVPVWPGLALLYCQARPAVAQQDKIRLASGEISFCPLSLLVSAKPSGTLAHT